MAPGGPATTGTIVWTPHSSGTNWNYIEYAGGTPVYATVPITYTTQVKSGYTYGYGYNCPSCTYYTGSLSAGGGSESGF
jgi:hypothetical protein